MRGSSQASHAVLEPDLTPPGSARADYDWKSYLADLEQRGRLPRKLADGGPDSLG